MKKYLSLLAAIILLSPATLLAQEARSYLYDSISVIYTVNTDSTVSVEEKLGYVFSGEYHHGWRTLSLKGADDITDIAIFDADGRPLKYVSDELNKTDPSSWGKYTVTKDSGARNVIWYYDARDEKRTWIISYTLHGAIRFLDDRDELYWNAVADYDVPVESVSVKVHIPALTESGKKILTVKEYPPSGVATTPPVMKPDRATFSAMGIPPKSAYTIAVGWPKDVVSHAAYVRYTLLLYSGYILAALIVLGSIAYATIKWYRFEGRLLRRGVIIPEYEPPIGIQPALAEYILSEKNSERGTAATVVDLAVRGYISIQEEEAVDEMAETIPEKNPLSLLRMLPLVLAMGIFGLMGFQFIKSGDAFGIIIGILIILPIIGVTIGMTHSRLKRNTKRVYYALQKRRDPDESLLPYESTFLRQLFNESDTFSTLQLQMALRKDPQVMKNSILKAALSRKSPLDTLRAATASSEPITFMTAFGSLEPNIVAGLTSSGLYDITPTTEQRANWVFLLIFVFVFVFITGGGFSELGCIVTAIVFSWALLYRMNRDVRLNAEGRVIRAELLGFKMYLETAERLRLQNLTPETFERFLPYAMAFGIEEKWARAFDQMGMQDPLWYQGSLGRVSFANGRGFSPSMFAGSLSASLGSSLNPQRSGSGGASGGGGSSGGGGGGGGGGAS